MGTRPEWRLLRSQEWDLTSPNRPCDEKCPATLVTLVRPALRMPPSGGDAANADGQPANLALKIIPSACCKSATPIVLSAWSDLRLPRQVLRLAHIRGQNTAPAHEPRNSSVQSARTNTAGRLGEGFRDVSGHRSWFPCTLSGTWHLLAFRFCN